MRFSFQASFIVISIAHCVNADKSPPSCPKPYDKMTACNLICNMIHDSDANNAMKMLQTKMESLTSVIKKPSPQPGKELIFCQYVDCSWIGDAFRKITEVSSFSSSARFFMQATV